MKRYSNKTRKLQKVKFSSGETQFLFEGQSILTNKSVDDITDGVSVDEVETKKKKKSSTKSSKDNESGSDE